MPPTVATATRTMIGGNHQDDSVEKRKKKALNKFQTTVYRLRVADRLGFATRGRKNNKP